MSIPDSQTAINALISGEIDMIEAPAHDLLSVLEKDKNVEIVIPDTLGSTYVLRFNWKQPPFNDVRYRRAAALALNQKDFLQAVIGDPRYYKVCKAMFGCGTPLETSAGMAGVLESDFEGSKKLLKELGYDGTPIVVLQSTDLASLTNLAPVAKTLLERGGFKVDMQSMDWQTLVARRTKKDPVAQGGWNIAMTAASVVLLLDPVNNHYAEASGDRAQFGWPLDEEIEKLRAAFVRESDPKKQLEIAEKVQTRIISEGVTIPLGQFHAADGAAQERERQRAVAGHRVLERREEVANFDWSCRTTGQMPLCLSKRSVGFRLTTPRPSKAGWIEGRRGCPRHFCAARRCPWLRYRSPLPSRVPPRRKTANSASPTTSRTPPPTASPPTSSTPSSRS